MAQQTHSGSGDNIGGDQINIDHQINQGDGSTYIEQQFINQPKPTQHYLTAPPFIPSVFEGREEELSAIRQKLFANHNPQHLLLLVNGEGGIGKTSLAAKYWQHYQTDYKHMAWLYVQAGIAEALLTLAYPLLPSLDERWDSQQRLDLILQTLTNLDKPCLLVLDNVNDPKVLQQGFLLLTRNVNLHILLTTRITHFEQAETYKIQPLPEDPAIAVFKTHYRSHRPQEDDLLRTIFRHVGGNTLVMELIAKTLAQRNALELSYSLTDLLADLHTQGVLSTLNRHAVTTAYPGTDNALRQDTPEAIITAMFDLAGLGEAESALLSVFSVLPAENIGYSALKTLLPASADLDLSLVALAQKGWLDREAGTDFKISPVIQDVVRSKHHSRLGDDCRNLIDGLIEHLEYEPGTGHVISNDYQQAALWARYAESVAKAIPTAGRSLAVLNERLGNFYLTTGNLGQALEYFEEYNRLSQALHADYPDDLDFKNGLAISYEKLGATHTALGNLAQALGYFEEYYRLSQALYSAYPSDVSFKNGLAISYSKLGATHTALGNLAEALEYFEEDMKLSQALYAAYPSNVSFKRGLAISYSQLGDTHTALGNLAQALGYFEEDMKLSQALYA
ncbi:MAG: NB-ARC domain-containing protein, partial [Methylobacter sp.]